MRIGEKKHFCDKIFWRNQNSEGELNKLTPIARTALIKITEVGARASERHLHPSSQKLTKAHPGYRNFCRFGYRVFRLPTDELWQTEGEKISLEEFAHFPLSQSLLTFGAITAMSNTEVEEPIKRTKSRKATGSHDIATEPWITRSWDPII